MGLQAGCLGSWAVREQWVLVAQLVQAGGDVIQQKR